MGMREVPSDVGQGSSAVAVAEQWRQHERKRSLNCGQGINALVEKAEAWLATSPEFLTTEGRPCVYAVEATLRLRARYGRSVNKAMVRKAWLAYLSRPRMEWYVDEFLPQLKTREVTS